MNNTVFHRRRAERFAQLLDEEPGRRPRDDSPLDGELGEFAELGLRLRRVTHPAEATPDDAFRTSLRAMLVATATREGIGRTAGGSAPALGRVGVLTPRAEAPETVPVQVGVRSRRARGAIVVGLAASALALSGISAASGDATPGGGFYPQRATEDAQLAQATSDMVRGQLYLEFAGARADEARARYASGADMTALLGIMDNQVRQGARLLITWAATRHDPRALDDIDAWLPSQKDRLTPLDTGRPARRVERSLALLSQIRDRSIAVRVTLGCGAVTGRSDELGPRPGACPVPNGTGGSGTRGGRSGSAGAPSGDAGNSGSGGVHPSLPPQPPSPTPLPTASAQPSDQQQADQPTPRHSNSSPTH